MVEDWQITLLLLSLHHVVDGATSNNLKKKNGGCHGVIW
jgi:hypothetical protein